MKREGSGTVLGLALKKSSGFYSSPGVQLPWCKEPKKDYEMTDRHVPRDLGDRKATLDVPASGVHLLNAATWVTSATPAGMEQPNSPDEPSSPIQFWEIKKKKSCFKLVNFKLVIYCCSVAKLCPTLCDPWTAAFQAPLSFTISQSFLRYMSIEWVMLSSHLILCHPLSHLPSIFPSIKVFSDEWLFSFFIRWPKYWNFSFSISPSNKYSRLISYRIDWFDLLAVQGTLKSLLQHHNLKTWILGNPLQYSCLENPMDGGAWWATDHRVAKSRTWLRDFPFPFSLPYVPTLTSAHDYWKKLHKNNKY